MSLVAASASAAPVSSTSPSRAGSATTSPVTPKPARPTAPLGTRMVRNPKAPPSIRALTGSKHIATQVKTDAVRAPAPAPAADSTLSGLAISGATLNGLAPAFAPSIHDYETVNTDDSQMNVAPTANQSDATVVVTESATTYPVTSGTATVPLSRGQNDVTVTVSSPDNSATTVYRITAWRLAAPTSRIITVSNVKSTVYGGYAVSVTLTHGQFNYNAPSYCYRRYSFGPGTSDRYAYGRSFDPSTGLTTDVVYTPASAGLKTGKVDLTLTNFCYDIHIGQYVQSSTTQAEAITYVDGFHISGADIPSTVTSGSAIQIHGTGVSANSALRYWISDANNNRQQTYTWNWTGDDNSTVYVEYPYGNDWYRGSGPRTFHIGYCPSSTYSIDDSCTDLLTKPVNWVEPDPTGMSLSPTSGPVAGGNKVRLRGRFLSSVSEDSELAIKVGTQTVSTYRTIFTAESDGQTFADYTQAPDILELTMPAGLAAGTVPISVTNDMGTTVMANAYTYAAKPTITSIAPATVANTGGSVITIQGTGFGTSGNPTVIIDGTKSPLVVRVSATTLTAVVPADTATTGPVDVSVSSAQGAGVSLPSTLTLQAPTTLPTITKVTPGSGHASDDVTITGTGFGSAGVGVTVDGQQARVSASSATSVTFAVPTTDTSGVKDLVVSATTGAVTKTNGFTVLADDGVTAVTPRIVPSYARGGAAMIAIDGVGFGSGGTIKIGSAAAVAYTATASGTHIANVVVPTGTAGALPIVITPARATTSLRAIVQVSPPKIGYVGSDPRNDIYGPVSLDATSGIVYNVPASGGTKMRIEGSGFGTAGTLTFGGNTVSTTSWTDTAITFTTPAHALGTVNLSVNPTNSAFTASYASAASYVADDIKTPAIGQIASVVDHSYGGRNEFNPVTDVSNAFTMSGLNLAGGSSAATRVIITDGVDTFTVVPSAVTATSLTFAAPRGFRNGGWKDVEVDTDSGTDRVNFGIFYQNAGVQLNVSPYYGLCLRTNTVGSGSVNYTPAQVTITNSASLFGNSGTVSIDGVAVTATSYTSGQVVISMANLAADLAKPWGAKMIVITPSDSGLASQQVGFTCAVQPSVSTTVNNSTDPLTVAAGTGYSLGYTTAGIVGSFSATAPSGYEYVSATDFQATGFTANVHAGAPVAAGDYYVRVALSRATYDTDRYVAFQPAPVRITITGIAVTITPVSDHGTSFLYRGQLGDGSNGTPPDFHYTATSTTDTITAVT